MWRPRLDQSEAIGTARRNDAGVWWTADAGASERSVAERIVNSWSAAGVELPRPRGDHLVIDRAGSIQRLRGLEVAVGHAIEQGAHQERRATFGGANFLGSRGVGLRWRRLAIQSYALPVLVAPWWRRTACTHIV